MSPLPDGLLAAMAAVRDDRPVKALTGYLDQAADPPRLYADVDLAVFVELKEVVAAEAGADPLDPWLVWVPQDLPLKLALSGRDPYGSVLGENPDTLFAPGPRGGWVPLGYRCPNPRTTSHTIGWCAND